MTQTHGEASARLADGAARVTAAWAAEHQGAGATGNGLVFSPPGAMRLIARVVERWRDAPRGAPPAHPESLLADASSAPALPMVVAALAELERGILDTSGAKEPGFSP